jgi:hypothetical protein
MSRIEIKDLSGRVYQQIDPIIVEVTGYQTVQVVAGEQGPAGVAGPAGPAGTGSGTVWYSGAGVPSNLLGEDGDFYLDKTSGDVYTKELGSWV